MSRTAILCCLCAGLALAAGPAGNWEGALKLPGASLRIVFHITAQPDQTLTATLDSPDQGANGIPVSKALLVGDTLTLKAASIGGVFIGRIAGDSMIEGTWTQGGGSLPLTVKRQAKPIEIKPKLQEPKKPYPYLDEEVAFENKGAGAVLAGTFTRPSKEGAYPAVVLITGSGPENRDEEVFGHKPFLVLADYLTRRGIAVLRYDDRGVGKSTGDYRAATSEDFASDVKAAVDYLKTRTDVDARRLGLVGHSEGGLIAPMVATTYPGIAFVVLLAGPGVNGEEIILRQSALIARAEGEPDSSLAQSMALQGRMFAVLKANLDSARTAQELGKIAVQAESVLRAETKDTSSAPRLQVEAQMKSALTPWFRFFLAYDPYPALEKLTCPVLALYGSKDLQVDPTQNAPRLEQAFKAGKNRDWTVRILPGLNHLFQPAKTGSPTEYAGIALTMSPAALDTIGDWIVKHTTKR